MGLNPEIYRLSGQIGVSGSVKARVILKHNEPLLYHVHATIDGEEHIIDMRDHGQGMRPMFTGSSHVIEWLTSMAEIIHRGQGG